ncbi:MAG: hypothetical protein ACN4GW_14095 [Desulforhopalus sp.]
MHLRQQASAEHVKGLIKKNPMPRNQIATISGLTNTYIRDLEQGNIANVERGKIIALALALNLNLMQLENMLRLFDRAPLSADDIPLFLATAEKKKTTSVLLPVRNRFSFDLYIIGALKRPGPYSLVSYKPMVALYPPGLWCFEQKERLGQHPLYPELTEAVGLEMGRQLKEHLHTSPIEQYVSQFSIEAYLSKNNDPEQREWNIQHVRRLIDHLERFPQMQFYLTHEDSSFLFTLKGSEANKNNGEQLLISKYAPPGPKRRNAALLAGFVTGNQVVIDNFKEELDILKSLVIEKYTDKEKLIRYLNQITG